MLLKLYLSWQLCRRSSFPILTTTIIQIVRIKLSVPTYFYNLWIQPQLIFSFFLFCIAGLIGSSKKSRTWSAACQTVKWANSWRSLDRVEVIVGSCRQFIILKILTVMACNLKTLLANVFVGRKCCYLYIHFMLLQLHYFCDLFIT